MSQGADGSATDVSSAAPLNVTLANTGANTNKLLVTPDLPSGAATSAKQDTGNTSLSSIDGKITAVNTGAVVVSSSALPSGAATSAKQPALGTAGTASADVITVQGKSGMTPVLVDGSGATQPVSGTVTATVTGVATSTKQSDGSQKTQIVDGSGNVIGATSNALDINIKSGNPTTIAATQSGTWNVTNVSGTISLPTGAATSANQSTEITSLATIAALSKAEDAPHSSSDTGIPAWAVRNDTGAVFAGSDGDYIPLATDATGALRVDLNGTLSTNNSTTSVLAGGAVFTGTSEDVLNYNEIRISVITSHVSASDGLSIQQSEDNTNWDFTDTYTIPATTGKTYSIPRQARYFRVVYTNGATLQTSFRLQTILNRLGARVSSQRPNDAYTNETDLEQTQSFLMGYNGTTWDRLRTIGTGVLTTSTVLTTGAAAIGSLTAGSAIIGKVGIDQTTPGTTNLVALAANQSVNVAQINAVTPLMGNGTTGTGSQRVTIASDNTAFAVNATLSAETTKVIGTINVAASQTIAVTNTGTFATQPTIQTGTNSIGKISDITTSMVPGTGSTNLGKAEDAAHTTGDTGVMALGVRNDTLADTTNTTADYSQLSTDIKGRIMTAGAPRSLKGMAQVSVSNTTSETTILAATASTFHDVYGIILANTGASTTKVSIRDDTAGTVRAIIEVPTLETRGFMLPVDSAVPQTAVNKNWTVQCGTATTALEVTLFYVSMV